MRRRASSGPKIAGRRNQPLAKMMLPNPVHHHSGRQRIRSAGQPIGQLQPTAAGRIGRNSLAAQNLQTAPRLFGPLSGRLAAQMDRRILRLSLGDRVGQFQRRSAPTIARDWRGRRPAIAVSRANCEFKSSICSAGSSAQGLGAPAVDCVGGSSATFLKLRDLFAERRHRGLADARLRQPLRRPPAACAANRGAASAGGTSGTKSTGRCASSAPGKG